MALTRTCDACGAKTEYNYDDDDVPEHCTQYKYCNDCQKIRGELWIEADGKAMKFSREVRKEFDANEIGLIQEERGRRNRDEARGEGQGGTGTGNQEFYRAATKPPLESEGGSEGVERKDTNSAGGGDRTKDPNLRQSHFPRCSSDELRPDPPREEGSGGCAC